MVDLSMVFFGGVVMKMLVAGVKRMSGARGSKSGQPFDFAEVYGLTVIEPVQNDKVRIQGHGYEPAKVPCDEGAVSVFRQYEGKFPLLLDLELDVVPFQGRFESIVTGVRSVVTVPVAAPAQKIA